MGRTMIEKIFSRHAGHDVKAGDIVVAPVDFAMLHDVNAPAAIDNFHELDVPMVMPKDRAVIVLDHFAPSPTPAAANSHKKIRAFAGKEGIRLYDVGEGICHQLVIEDGFIKPGSLNVATDSHTCSYGALNAAGFGIGASEMAVVLASGVCWFKAPETVKVVLGGKLPPYAGGKDVALKLIKLVTEKGAIYKNFEFAGAVGALSVEARITVCNMVVEMGAKSAVMPGDEALAGWLEKNGQPAEGFVAADEDAAYCSTVNIDLSILQSQVAMPPDIDNVADVNEIKGKKIDQVFIGSCTNGRWEDFALAAQILRGRKVGPGVRLIVAPASRSIYSRLLKEGLLEDLIQSGAVVNPPGCGPCAGLHGGLIGDGEAVLSTTNRNMKGRMGSSKGDIYIASPAVAAASAIAGHITWPGAEVCK